MVRIAQRILAIDHLHSDNILSIFQSFQILQFQGFPDWRAGRGGRWRDSRREVPVLTREEELGNWSLHKPKA